MKGLSQHRAEAYKEVFDDPFAFVAVLSDGHGALGIAKANERGYFSIPLGWAAYETLDSAQQHADHLNAKLLGLDDDTEFQIIASTMGGLLYVQV